MKETASATHQLLYSPAIREARLREGRGAVLGGSCLFLARNLVQRCCSAGMGTRRREVAAGASGEPPG